MIDCGPNPAGGLAAVFLDGDYEDAEYYLQWARVADVVVAADGGGRFLAAAGVVPDALVGDFDSLDEAVVAEMARRGARVLRHPVRKDETDGELAAAEALRSGVRDLVLAGALGALDHVLGHLALLAAVEARGATARIVSPDLTVRVLTAPATVRLSAAPGTRVSLAPLWDEALVTLNGLEYDVVRGRLSGDACLGLGNAVTSAASIELHGGRLAVLVFDGEEGLGGLRVPRRRRSGGEAGL